MGNPAQKGPYVKAGQPDHFDAIVVGSGISGGWAAKELCEKGLKTLVVERGRNVEHVRDYPTSVKNPWDFKYRITNTNKDKEESPLHSGAFDEATKQFYVNDTEHPYIQETPFYWLRGYQVGGRSLTWGRQCYRMSDLDFEANVKDGIAVDWPIRYRDLAAWYDYVETYVGISGKEEGLPQLPDGKFLPPIEMNCIEDHFSQKVRDHYNDRIVTIGRVANLTRGWNGRGPCQYRNLCDRGCPFGGYFSSNAATLPAAEATGNMMLLTDAIVSEVIYDENDRKARGIRVINALTNEVSEYYARIIFLNASTIATAAILLNSVSRSFPTGLGNSSGQIGHNLMDHFIGTGVQGVHDAFQDKYYTGRKPVGIYVPRFRNLPGGEKSKGFIRGYGFQGVGSRAGWKELGVSVQGFGPSFKEELLKPGPWQLWMGAWGETLPYYENRVKLDAERKDKWGLPLVSIHFEYGENEKAMSRDIRNAAEEMLEVAGFRDINSYSYLQPGGAAIHEMGTARMGFDPKTSVLNAFNQMHDVKNVFITDGSCMTSAGCQNPSLTYMALTARACNFAVEEMKKGNL